MRVDCFGINTNLSHDQTADVVYPCVTLQRIDTPLFTPCNQAGQQGTLLRFQFDAWASNLFSG